MTIGLYHPAFWHQHGHWPYSNQTLGNTGRWDACSYRINDYSLRESDFVVVHENLDRTLNVRSSQGCYILITGEEKSVCNYHPEFINQFDYIITSRDDIKHPGVIQMHYLNPWRIKKTYDELAALDRVEKTKNLSAIISGQETLPMQKVRVRFMNMLKEDLGDELFWFSKGRDTFIHDKWDGLHPFKYSIAIENSRHLNYFTEKISDCFLSYTMPIYDGCPNIRDFFDDRSFIQINIDDWDVSRETIRSAIHDDLYNRNLKYIQESRRLVLEKYHLIAALSDKLKSYAFKKAETSRRIRPQSFFLERRLQNFLKKLIRG